MNKFCFLSMTKELSEALVQEKSEVNCISCVEKIFASYQGNDVEKKSALDQATRDVVKGYRCSDLALNNENRYQNGHNDTKSSLKSLIRLVIQLSLKKYCTNNLTIMLMSDIFEAFTLEESEEMFSFVEENVSTWTSEPFFSTGKNHLLRMCNDLLRRLSKTQNTVFCGRIQLFLAQLFPIEEKSGLNLNSNFHTENVTVFQKTPSSKEYLTDGMEEGEVATNPVDYNLYVKFWSLQEYFREPPKCYSNSGWENLKTGILEVLKVFESQKLEFNVKKRKSQEENLVNNLNKNDTAEKLQNYFAKYLTNEKLLNLQINDSNFRRYFLVQVLILFQYLNGVVKFKGPQQTLNDVQSGWIKEISDKVYSIIRDIPPNGKHFSMTVKHILTREENWINWKNDGCPSFAKSLTKIDQPKEQQKKGKRRGIGEEYLLNKKKRINMGTAELSRLWNLHPDNLEACKQEHRLKFLPTLEDFFEESVEQADPEAGIEEEYKLVNNPNFQWKSLRLLARRSHHFFTPSTTPFKVLPDYLKSVIDNISEDLKREADTNKDDCKSDDTEETYVTTSQIPETS